MPPSIPKDAVALLAKIPVIPSARRLEALAQLYARLKVLLERSPRTELRSILKYTTCIVFLLNFGSLPFVWHIRVFWHLLLPRFSYWALCLKLVFASKKERTHALIGWAEDLPLVGTNPFEVNTVDTRWATLDDCDMFGMHLSNSCYAKALDSARAKAAVQYFPTWGRSGGKLALGATHFHYLREIPPLARYEIRISIGSWDHKWLYIVARFVTRDSGRHASRRSPQSSTPPTTDNVPVQNGSADLQQVVAAVIQENNGMVGTRRAPILEPDGAILHCIAVSQICYKWGRISVPPAVVLASEGFTKPYGDSGKLGSADAGVRSYSRANPPPNWIKSQSIRVPPHGSMDEFRAFLGGGWRDVPDGERWWEDALGGSVEAKRRANIEILDSLRLGLEGVRTMREA